MNFQKWELFSGSPGRFSSLINMVLADGQCDFLANYHDYPNVELRDFKLIKSDVRLKSNLVHGDNNSDAKLLVRNATFKNTTYRLVFNRILKNKSHYIGEHINNEPITEISKPQNTTSFGTALFIVKRNEFISYAKRICSIR